MAINVALEREIVEFERKLTRAVDEHPPFTLTPAWWQERLLDWATTDPDFRVKLLRFVDVLPALRSASAVADHVRQYFRGSGPGLISTASGLASQPVFRPVLSKVVRTGVYAMAERFIAGANPAEAVPSLHELAEQGTGWTVDLLGEETLSDSEAELFLQRYLDLVETLSNAADEIGPRGERWQSVAPVNISIKLSALVPHLEPAAPEWVSEIARGRLRPLLRLARESGAFINVDMEQYRYKDVVHQAFADLLLEPEFASFEDVGIVVQAYLRDALEDVRRLRALAERRGAPFWVRLVKGAYWDEEGIVADQNSWPIPVWTDKPDTDTSFESCTDALLDAWPHLRPAFGTHNPRSAAQAAVKAGALGVPQTGIEFQTLYGMAEGLRGVLSENGYRTRVYLPVGEVIPGMAYLVRRLLENTSNQAWFHAGGVSGEHSRDGRAWEPSESGQPSVLSRDFRNAPTARFFDPDVRKHMSDAIEGVRSTFGRLYPLLICEREVKERTEAKVESPADPSLVIGRVAQATGDDVEAAVAAAREAFPAWRDISASGRADILSRAADILEERRYELAATMVFESAKPWYEADGDVIEAVDYLRYYAAQGERLATPEETQDVRGEETVYFHEGRGVAAIIAPWNFPLAIICGMTTAALAGGNCAILKPAAQSPIIAYKLVEILREAGVPPAVVQYLPGPGGEVGRALVEHPGIDAIAFTGSSEVGLGIIESAARVPRGSGIHPDHSAPGTGHSALRPNVKRVIAEMGGKNAIIIDDDADLDQAIGGALVSAFGYAGQKCSACSRLIIVGSAYSDAVGRLRHAVASLVVGPPHDPSTFVPPVISAQAREKIMGYIDSGRETSTLLVQGEISHTEGHYVPPTVFTDVPLDSPLARDEIFGPVLTVFRAEDFNDALRIALDSDFALTGGLYSRNPRNIERAKRGFRVGNLYINRKTTGAVVGRHPFGGLHMSGIGEKAGGPDYVRQFMDPRTVSENTMRRGFAPDDNARAL
jgi:RHH-type proline utilization regulon transcriptional repressor/proline dehydrogenase/delta 1-pyrroline-5-carboxylate dehydrogenase